jgi:hypothetical protein
MPSFVILIACGNLFYRNSKVMKTVKEKLTDSPLFNLSLTNKELFHSNFIAWFGTLYPELFIQLINNLLGDNKWADGLDVKKIDLRREYNNFDISVFDSEDSKVPRLIIENKVKSVPTQAQLKEYQDKINNDENVALLLLTMNEQIYSLTEDECDTRWKIVNYKTLSTALRELPDKNLKPYHRMLVKDYCQYVYDLQQIICDFTSGDNFLYDSDCWNLFMELGIHDVCGKRKVQNTYSMLVQALKDKSIDVVYKLDELKERPGSVHAAWAYTNAPLIEVKLKTKIDVDEFILIQIQGKQYRHAVEYFDEQQTGYRIEDRNGAYFPSPTGISYLKETYPGFLFGDDALNNYPVFDTQKVKCFGQRSKDGKEGYCKYCNGRPSLYNGLYSCFVYQWVELPPNITISKLIDAIVADITNLRNLYAPI